jgi:hypothetical protein
MQRMEQTEIRKTFVSAILRSEYLQYKLHIIIFVLVPVAMVFSFFQALRAEEFHFTFLMVLVTFAEILFGLILLTGFYLFRNYSPYKIITDQTGLYYFSLLRRVHVRWDQVQSVKVPTGIIGRRFFELKTKNDKIYISILMKERDNPYPKLSMVNNKWIDADGIETPIGVDNCPLYKEIQKHLGK